MLTAIVASKAERKTLPTSLLCLKSKQTQTDGSVSASMYLIEGSFTHTCTDRHRHTLNVWLTSMETEIREVKKTSPLSFYSSALFSVSRKPRLQQTQSCSHLSYLKICIRRWPLPRVPGNSATSKKTKKHLLKTSNQWINLRTRIEMFGREHLICPLSRASFKHLRLKHAINVIKTHSMR